MPKTAVGLMARFPQFGLVKTRLAAIIGEPKALEVYQQLLDHSLSVLKSLDSQSYISAVHVEPESMVTQFVGEVGAADFQFGQAGANLGLRMQAALERMFDIEGVTKGVLIGADIPRLSTEHVKSASDLLDRNDLVFGPSEDGGYYLIGMNRVEKDIFEGPDWGSDRVLQDSLAIARQSGLQTGLLTELSDLDLYEDLTGFPEFSRFVK